MSLLEFPIPKRRKTIKKLLLPFSFPLINFMSLQTKFTCLCFFLHSYLHFQKCQQMNKILPLLMHSTTRHLYCVNVINATLTATLLLLGLAISIKLFIIHNNFNTKTKTFPKSSQTPPSQIFAMNSLLLLFLASSLILHLEDRSAKTNSHIIVMGFVYCDICSNNSFSKNSYFIPGAEVRIDCTIKAMSPRTAEQISFSVNRTTNKYGVFKLEIPSVDGIKCAEDSANIASSCQASLINSSSSSCNVPGYKDTSDQIAIKSKRANLCIYSFNPLSFRPSKKETSLCGNSK